MHNGTHLQFHVKALIVSGFHPVALTVVFYETIHQMGGNPLTFYRYCMKLFTFVGSEVKLIDENQTSGFP
jgi:hypothetical protein